MHVRSKFSDKKSPNLWERFPVEAVLVPRRIVVELLAGALTGGGCGRPEETVQRANMLSIFVDPGVFTDADAVAKETGRFLAWAKSSAPIDPDAEVLMPGEIEQKTMAARTSDGIDIDETTWSQIVETAASVGLSAEKCTRLVGN